VGRRGAASSDEKGARRSWGAGDLVSSCYRALAGAGRGLTRCPPGNRGSSEVRVLRSRQLRRGGSRRRTGRGAFSSGERSLTGVAVPGNSPSSCYRWLAGAGRGFGCCPPAKAGSSEERDFTPASAPAWGFPPVIRSVCSFLR